MASQRPFRFGLTLANAKTRAEWLDKARRVEAHGYHTALVADHAWLFPPISGMLAIAQATTTVRVGSYVLGNDFWQPVWLARELAAIDVLSEGRLEVGIGTGYFSMDYDASGVKLDSPRDRVGRFAEAVQVIKGLFAEPPFSFAGKYYTIGEVSISPRPVQRPRPPFVIGGGAKRMLTLAAQEADIVSINVKTTPTGGFDFASISPEATEQKIGWVREAAPDRFDSIELSMVSTFAAVTEDRRTAAQHIADEWTGYGFEISTDQLLESPHALLGSVEQICEQLLATRERFGISYIVVFEDQLDAFAPVVARLAGK